jgi:predicted phage terminase large subunit-like protein
VTRPLSARDLAVWRALERAAGGDSILDVIPRISQGFEAPHHLRPLADAISRSLDGPVRVALSVPPRHGKTETILHACAWYLLMRPRARIAYVGHTAALARKKSRDLRAYVAKLGVRLRSDSRAVDAWETEQGGMVLALGVGGPLTGHGVDLLIVDDPIKNREEAESGTIRAKIYDWFTSTALTRVEPGGSVIVSHTRWHTDDLIGRLTDPASDAGPWEYVHLPAIMDDGTDHARTLWPSRWPLGAMRDRAREVGPYDWASLYQGQPRPRGSGVFSDPARYVDPGIADARSGPWRILIGVDPAATASNRADHSCAVVVATQGRPGTLDFRADVLDVWRDRVEIPQLCRQLARLSRKWGAPLAIEAVAGFKAVPQFLRQIDVTLRIYETYPQGDKFVRALGASAAWNDGRIRVPVDAPWVGDFVREFRAFTGQGDRQDDQVDALTVAYNALAQNVQRTPAKTVRDVGWY